MFRKPYQFAYEKTFYDKDFDKIHLLEAIFDVKSNISYVNIICVNEEFRSRDTISELEEKLKKNSFVKINSGAIVNLTQIVSLKKDRVILSNKSEYSISRKYQAIVKTKYMEYMRFQEMTKLWN